MIGARFVRGDIGCRSTLLNNARLDKVCLDLIAADIGKYDIVDLDARLKRLSGFRDHFAIVGRVC